MIGFISDDDHQHNRIVIIVIYKKDKYQKMKIRIIKFIQQRILNDMKNIYLIFRGKKRYMIKKILNVKKTLIGMTQ